MRRCVLGILFFLLNVFLFSQESSQTHLQMSLPANNNPQNGMYLIPQIVYVGDRATLVLPLGAAYAEAENIVVTEKNLLPVAPDLVILKMEIETESGVPRLLVDFRSYAPGIIEFPPLTIGAYQFTGLTANINSILENDSDRLLSDAASSMAVPGTLLLTYGSIIALVVFLLMAVFLWIWGVPAMKRLSTQRHRRFVLRALKRSMQKIRASLAKNNVSPNILVTKISYNFRSFLSFFTKTDCFVLVPKEFLRLPKMMKLDDIKGGENYIVEHVDTLYEIFRRCDELRFSGNAYETESVLRIVDSVNRFAAGFEEREKESFSSSRKFVSPLSSRSEASS